MVQSGKKRQAQSKNSTAYSSQAKKPESCLSGKQLKRSVLGVYLYI